MNHQNKTIKANSLSLLVRNNFLQFLKRTSVFVTAITLIAGGFFVPVASAATSVLGVTQISAVSTFAQAGGDFAGGWKWVFSITVPDNEPILTMKFADWTNGSNTILAGSNIRFYSAQSSNASAPASAITITTAGTYSSVMNLNLGTDLDAVAPGRQIQVTVEARIPVGSAGGSYSTSYGVNSVAPDITALITSISTSQTAHDAAVEGTVPSNHVVGSKATLQSAIDTATTAQNTSPTTQSDVDAAKSTLDTALTTFNLAVVPASDVSLLIVAKASAQGLIDANATESTTPGDHVVG
ncbi:MAG: hypothetical protein Q7K40_00475, partial [bacterium]|nr:hypothetical protein [bacterium]